MDVVIIVPLQARSVSVVGWALAVLSGTDAIRIAADKIFMMPLLKEGTR
jgi:hypothetical protein